MEDAFRLMKIFPSIQLQRPDRQLTGQWLSVIRSKSHSFNNDYSDGYRSSRTHPGQIDSEGTPARSKSRFWAICYLLSCWGWHRL